MSSNLSLPQSHQSVQLVLTGNRERYANNFRQPPILILAARPVLAVEAVPIIDSGDRALNVVQDFRDDQPLDAYIRHEQRGGVPETVES